MERRSLYLSLTLSLSHSVAVINLLQPDKQSQLPINNGLLPRLICTMCIRFKETDTTHHVVDLFPLEPLHYLFHRIFNYCSYHFSQGAPQYLITTVILS